MITFPFGYGDFPIGAVPLITTELALLVIGGFVGARGSVSVFTRILLWLPGLLLVMGLLAQQTWTLPLALAVFTLGLARLAPELAVQREGLQFYPALVDLACCCFLIFLVEQEFVLALLGLMVFPFRFGSRYASSCALLVGGLQERLREPCEHQPSGLPGLRRSPR